MASLTGKARAAFRSGFLGIDSLGWSTLVQVVEASEEDRAAAVELLARRLVERFGAPDLATAKAAAEEEIAFAASLSDHAEGMVIALARRHESGDIREAFRTLAPGVAAKPHRVLAFVEETTGRRRRLWRRSTCWPSPRRSARERAARDFWLSCGHHLLDRDADGRLIVTDEFLKAYLARPEIAPPPEACAAERALHEMLLADPRRPVGRAAGCGDRRCRRARELGGDARLPRSADAPCHAGGRLPRHCPAQSQAAAPLSQPDRARHPAQHPRRLRRRLRAARGRDAVQAAAADRAPGVAGGRRRRGPVRARPWAGLAAGLDARTAGSGRDRRAERGQRRHLLAAQRPVRHGARPDRRPPRPDGAGRGDAALDCASARHRG